MKLLYASNHSSRYVHGISPLRCGITLGNYQDNFDVRQFLSGALEELPPMPTPIVATEEGKPRFKGVRHSRLLRLLPGLIFLRR